MGIKLKTLFNLMEINFHLSLSPNTLPGAALHRRSHSDSEI